MSIFKKVVRKINIEKGKLKKGKNNSINWALVGTGPMSEHFCKALILNPDANIIAVSSRDKKKAMLFSKKYNIDFAYGSYQEMLENDKIDIVYVATPVFSHFEIGKYCLQKKKNVLIEKPLTYTLQETKELISLSKVNNTFLMEAMWSKCLPTFKEIKKVYDDQIYGKLKSIRIDLSKNVVIDPNRYEFSKEYGSVLHDYGVYPLSYVTDFMAEDFTLEYVNRNDNWLGNDASWNIVLSDRNIMAHITISNQYIGGQTCRFHFEKGSVELPGQFNRTNTISYFNNINEKTNEIKFRYAFEGFEYQIEEVHNCLKQKALESSKVTHASTLKSMELIDLLLRERRKY